MHTFARGLSMRRSISPSSSNLPPIVSPWPAEFSKIISTSSGVSARTAVAASQICSNTASSPMPLWLPVWKITPSAPMRPAMFIVLRSVLADVLKILGSALARFIRYLPWMNTGPMPDASIVSRNSATPSSSMLRRAPLLRRRLEDLHALGADRGAALEARVQPARRRYVSRRSSYRAPAQRPRPSLRDRFKCATAPPASDHAGHGALVRRGVVRRAFDRRHT